SAAELAERLTALRDAGVEDRFLVVDPGLGFSKTGEQNWDVLAGWERLDAHGLPILIGASRKRFVGALGVDRHLATAALSAHSAGASTDERADGRAARGPGAPGPHRGDRDPRLGPPRRAGGRDPTGAAVPRRCDPAHVHRPRGPGRRAGTHRELRGGGPRRPR